MASQDPHDRPSSPQEATRKVGRISIRCDVLDWHRPRSEVGFDGASFTSTCDRCGSRILQDSQGNWFRQGRYT